MDRDEYLRLARIFRDAAGAVHPMYQGQGQQYQGQQHYEGPFQGWLPSQQARSYSEKEAIVGAVLSAIADGYQRAADEIP